MPHRLYTIISALSLMLCAALIIVRATSFNRPIYAVSLTLPETRTVSSENGWISVARVKYRESPPPRDPLGDAKMVVALPNHGWSHGGLLRDIGIDYYDETPSTKNIFYTVEGIRRYRGTAVSYGLLIFLTAAMPLVWAYRARRRQIWRNYRRKAGLCIKCGYDLRATAQRCPECGTVKEPSIAKD